jgi:hypothetical protein
MKIWKAIQEITRSQQRLNAAMISDIEALAERVKRIEGYIQLLEARRDNELKRKKKSDG